MYKISFMIVFYIPHSENLYTIQNAKYYIKISNNSYIAETRAKVLRLNMTSITKVNVVCRER